MSFIVFGYNINAGDIPYGTYFFYYRFTGLIYSTLYKKCNATYFYL